MRFVALIFLLFFSSLFAADQKSVLVAILAKDKAHVLPRYLKCLDELEYDKKLITLYINTNNNTDNTQELLEEWTKQHEKQYRAVHFEAHNVKQLDQTKPHEWTAKRFKVLGEIRNKSMQKALENKCDYYFVVDCDNFIAPYTLRELISKDKPIIAPMLRAIPESNDHYSNYFCDTTSDGYFNDHPDYLKILSHAMVGTFKVPVAHCTYLINSNYIDKLNYIDDTNDHEFVVFSRIARQNNVDQYICNEKDFGELLHFHDSNLTLQEEKNRFDAYMAGGKTSHNREAVFTSIYDKGEWGRDQDGKSTSGGGSTFQSAKPYLEFLTDFVKERQIKSAVDLGCGIWHFSQNTIWEKAHYIGIDVVKSVIEHNLKNFNSSTVTFKHSDGLNSDLPDADLLVCKDVLQHLSTQDIFTFLEKTKKYKHCLIVNDVNTHSLTSPNTEITTGDYRTLDLTKAPFYVKGVKIFTYRATPYHIKQVLYISNEGLQNQIEDVFTGIYDNGEWGRDKNGKGTSGYGSSEEGAKEYIAFLKKFVDEHQIQSAVDLGCGLWAFSQHPIWENRRYLGIDVVKSAIEEDQKNYGTATISFKHANALNAELPDGDLLICKDVLQHLPTKEVTELLTKIKKYKHCLITNDVDPQTLTSSNEEVYVGGCRTLDLTKPPFNLKGTKIFTFYSGATPKQVLYIQN